VNPEQNCRVHAMALKMEELTRGQDIDEACAALLICAANKMFANRRQLRHLLSGAVKAWRCVEESYVELATECLQKAVIPS